MSKPEQKSQQTTAMPMEGLGNVDQIREIIFGSQMRDFTEKFSKFEARMQALHNEMKEQIRDQHDVMTREIENTTQLLDKKIKNLSALSQEERDALKEDVMRLDKRITLSLDSFSDENDAKLAIMKKENLAANNKLKDDLQQLRTSVYEDLEKRLTQMGNVKVSRDHMAEMLLDMAMRIKSNDSENDAASKNS